MKREYSTVLFGGPFKVGQRIRVRDDVWCIDGLFDVVRVKPRDRPGEYDVKLKPVEPPTEGSG